ncbi:hypothetical protein DIPPA_12462 [Diplonema papillatum]|nr:hypothetical protein DIPPA_12462 [Diplonema papillatum]
MSDVETQTVEALCQEFALPVHVVLHVLRAAGGDVAVAIDRIELQVDQHDGDDSDDSNSFNVNSLKSLLTVLAEVAVSQPFCRIRSVQQVHGLTVPEAFSAILDQGILSLWRGLFYQALVQIASTALANDFFEMSLKSLTPDRGWRNNVSSEARSSIAYASFVLSRLCAMLVVSPLRAMMVFAESSLGPACPLTYAAMPFMRSSTWGYFKGILPALIGTAVRCAPTRRAGTSPYWWTPVYHVFDTVSALMIVYGHQYSSIFHLLADRSSPLRERYDTGGAWPSIRILTFPLAGVLASLCAKLCVTTVSRYTSVAT